MRSLFFPTLFALLLAATLSACGSEVAVGSTDATVDAASRDGGPLPDAGPSPAPDASGTDAGAVDAGEPPGAPCSTATPCPSGHYCLTSAGACGGAGTCQSFDPSVSCDVFPSIVCGCDGHTYNNDCAARRAGVAVDHADMCPPVPDGCVSDLDCDPGDFCEAEDGACAGTGTCVSRGIGVLCADICDPECGCDGTTYQNPCLRRKAAASLMQASVCPGGVPPCTVGGACCSIGVDCGLGQECVIPAGTTMGKCLPTGPTPDCWADVDCGVGHTCVDPYFCACDGTCPRPDTPGTCTP